MGHLRSVNLAHPRPNPAKPETGSTGIDKRPTDQAVEVRAPGGTVGSGLVGDAIFDSVNHGGDEQAVYAYAREALDEWEKELGRELSDGCFGENLTTRGIAVDDALIGERWRVGEQVLLEVTVPRVPCSTFADWLAEQRWVKRFTQRALPGAYLRVLEPGVVRAGDQITVEYRPAHDLTIAETFRALTTEPELLPKLIDVAELPEQTRELARRRTAPKS
ncbi:MULTISPECIES: MOSC domain-containing protein [unclassified Kitasatospora]|uniref:MOSC domain-containing protein n=1 Tax=unclassified Kitasatospora TaxID=2633591 RepID=UPI000A4C78D0|nr:MULTISPECIES: MOSC domain-containing protein [unclassified Kitasatospora]